MLVVLVLCLGGWRRDQVLAPTSEPPIQAKSLFTALASHTLLPETMVEAGICPTHPDLF